MSQAARPLFPWTAGAFNEQRLYLKKTKTATFSVRVNERGHNKIPDARRSFFWILFLLPLFTLNNTRTAFLTRASAEDFSSVVLFESCPFLSLFCFANQTRVGRAQTTFNQRTVFLFWWPTMDKKGPQNKLVRVQPLIIMNRNAVRAKPNGERAQVPQHGQQQQRQQRPRNRNNQLRIPTAPGSRAPLSQQGRSTARDPMPLKIFTESEAHRHWARPGPSRFEADFEDVAQRQQEQQQQQMKQQELYNKQAAAAAGQIGRVSGSTSAVGNNLGKSIPQANQQSRSPLAMGEFDDESPMPEIYQTELDSDPPVANSRRTDSQVGNNSALQAIRGAAPTRSQNVPQQGMNTPVPTAPAFVPQQVALASPDSGRDAYLPGYSRALYHFPDATHQLTALQLELDERVATMRAMQAQQAQQGVLMNPMAGTSQNALTRVRFFDGQDWTWGFGQPQPAYVHFHPNATTLVPRRQRSSHAIEIRPPPPAPPGRRHTTGAGSGEVGENKRYVPGAQIHPMPSSRGFHAARGSSFSRPETNNSTPPAPPKVESKRPWSFSPPRKPSRVAFPPKSDERRKQMAPLGSGPSKHVLEKSKRR